MKLCTKFIKPQLIFLYSSLFVGFVSIALFRYLYLGGDAGDSAVFQNIATQSSFPSYRTEFLKSIQLIIRRFVTNPTEVNIFDFPNDDGLDGILIGAHAYLIFPIISEVSKIFGFRALISIIAAAIAIAPLLIAVRLITVNGSVKEIKKFSPILLVLVSYPALIWSGMGQFYPDRIFLVTFPLLLLIIDRLADGTNRKIKIMFLLVYILNISITERSSLYVGLVCGIYFLKAEKNKKLLFVSTLAAMLWTFYYYKNVSTDIYTNSFFDTAKSISGLHALIFSIPTLKLILIHIPGIVLFRKMRHLSLIFTLAIIPNILGNVGGAEKTGWVTHYMSYIAATYISLILVWLQRQLPPFVKENKEGKRKSHGSKRIPITMKNAEFCPAVHDVMIALLSKG